MKSSIASQNQGLQLIERALAAGAGTAILDSASGAPGSETWVGMAPRALLRGHIDQDWAQVSEAMHEHQGQSEGGLMGWVGFDGQFVFGVYPQIHRCAAIAAFPGAEAPMPPIDFQPMMRREDFIRMVQRAQDYISAGDIYQVNLSHPWHARWPEGAAPASFYTRLRRASPAPFAAYFDLDDTRVFSSSPECFLRMRGRSIETHPIKGTRPRVPHDEARDAASARELSASIKERAELLMITDLERNDIGQVCEFGSVHVPALADVQSFAQVFHLVSIVRGTLREGIDHASAFKACFPGGSISGAPKKRALEIIHELEPHPRGLYTGAIGCFGFNGESQFSIAIRTAVEREGIIHFHTGAGIVADSVPELEYEETLHKAAGILRAARGDT